MSSVMIGSWRRCLNYCVQTTPRRDHLQSQKVWYYEVFGWVRPPEQLLYLTSHLPLRTAYMKIYQSLSLRTLAVFSLGMCNGSHRPAEAKGKQKRTENRDVRQCGSALQAPSELQVAITKLCSVKKVNVGRVTAKLDLIFDTNSLRAAALRERKRKEEEEAETRKIHKKGIKFNKNMEEPLAATIGDLLAHMNAMNNAIGVSRDYLRRQCNARMMRAEIDKFAYPSIGDQFRNAKLN